MTMSPMENPLHHFNVVYEDEAVAQLLSLCGATRWARMLARSRPFVTVADFEEAADRIWSEMSELDWFEAIACHPRIGEKKMVHAAGHATTQSQQWSAQEQGETQLAETAVLVSLAEANGAYEEKFGITYIVCATGKSAAEMLAILRRRLNSTRDAELREAAEQQRLITGIRIRKWLRV